MANFVNKSIILHKNLELFIKELLINLYKECGELYMMMEDYQ